MGSSSSTAQLQANPASIPATLLPITGVIPFSETLFLWQSLATAGALVIASTLIAWWTAPGPVRAKTAADLGIALDTIDEALPPRERPGGMARIGPRVDSRAGRAGRRLGNQRVREQELARRDLRAQSCNLIFLLLGMLLHWRPRRFLRAVSKAVPVTSGVLIQFPL